MTELTDKDKRQIVINYLASEIQQRQTVTDHFTECIKILGDSEHQPPNLRPKVWYEAQLMIRTPELNTLKMLLEYVEVNLK